MLIEILNSPILVDGKPMINSMRINLLPKQRQLRAKLRMPHGDDEELIDIVVMRFALKPVLKAGIPITLSAEGEELESKTKFNLSVTYELYRDKWSVTGALGYTQLQETADTLPLLFNKVLARLPQFV